jgi:hypothetical protein
MNTEDNAYEKAGLSSLERLVGKCWSIVCHVQDYIELIFEDELVLTCYALPIVELGDREICPNTLGYNDAIVALVGKTVQSVRERPRIELSLWFDSNEGVTISLRPEVSRSVEAAMLHRRGVAIYNVWRY